MVHQARFGMFIHFGVYSVLGRHEWVMEDEGIPFPNMRRMRCNSSRSQMPPANGENRARYRHALHGDDLEASRGLLQFRYKAH